MAVMPMKRLQLVALKSDRKEILELMQRMECVEIHCDLEKDEVFTQTDMTINSARYQKHSEAAENALEILEKVAPETKSALSSFAGRQELDVSEYEKYAGDHKNIAKIAYTIIDLDKQAQELKAEIPKLRMENTSLKPWKTLDIPLDLMETKTTDILAGSLPGDVPLGDILTHITEVDPELEYFDTQIVSHSEFITCVLFVVRKDMTQRLSEAVRDLGFQKAPLSDRVPADEIKKVKEHIAEDKLRLKEINEEIASHASDREKLKFIHDYYAMRKDKYEILGGLVQSPRTFVVSGYIPAEDTAELEKKLEPFDTALEFTDPADTDDVPVKLKNNAYVTPVEGVLESYSMPGKGELDPCGIMATFYYICYGLMLSDAAYGLIMVIATTVCLKKFPKMEEGMKKFMKMFFFCGISTTFWGLMFGSFFGDSVNVIATTFFNRPDITLPAIWFEPVNKPMKMLVFSFVVGIIHLFTGLGIKFYADWKQGKKLDAVYDVVFWYMLVGGGIVYLLTMQMFTDMLGVGFTLPAMVGTIAAAVAGIGAVGIVLTAGRESKNWFKRILKGLYGVYGVTSYLSDILSYSRLLALGLATSVISTVFNKMGSMLGNSVIGVIVFIVVFLIGHTMNILINALGAYVHTNRLQYVEFFGKFYEGGGRKIDPFGEKTKYYKIMEAK